MRIDSAATLRGAVRAAAALLEQAGVEAPLRNAEWLLMHVLGCGRLHLVTDADAPLDADARRRFHALVERRAAREPLQYVLGQADFRGLRIDVAPGVLIPRPETEEVVGRALERVSGVEAPRVLDVGTGSGCIALAVKHARPDARVWACDVSPAALAIARANARRLQLDVSFLEADARSDDFATRLPDALDLLVSNPPYVPDAERDTLEPEVGAHEPHLALFSGPDPQTFYRAIARAARARLRPGGWIVFEGHADHATGTRDVLDGAGFEDTTVARDMAGHERIVEGRQPR